MPKTILIIEDNDLNMKLFVDLLGFAGYSLLAVEDGLPGLRLMRQHLPQLVILDIQLRDISGLEVARHARAEPALARIPILAVSAFASSKDREAVLAAGCNRYLSKPFLPMQLIAEVKDLIGSASSGS
jgi:two-component system, cell cycle response regulator DivK